MGVCLYVCVCFLQHEEVQYLESELENQKQKYDELERFTKSLLNAVRNHDQEKQQVYTHTHSFVFLYGMCPVNTETTVKHNSIRIVPNMVLSSVHVHRSYWPVYLSLQTRIGTHIQRGEASLLP